MAHLLKVVLALVAVVGIATVAFLLLASRGSLPSPVAAPAESRTKQPPPSQAEAAASEQAFADARRLSLEQRWRSARSIAVEKWRADMLTANALGEIGAIPPMLEVHVGGSQVRLTNRGAGPVCVQMARVTRPDSDAVERCQLGPPTCSPIKPGATLRLPGAGSKGSCPNAVLEYRVGNVDAPEPSWWSRTAFNAFGDPPADISYKDEADLQADIARFEATVEDQDRATRWRRELMPPVPPAR